MATTPQAAVEFDVAFLEGFARHLADADVGAWSAAGAYASDQTGIVIGVIPQSPDQVIVLASYGVEDDPTLSDSTIGLQVTTRWGGQDPRHVDRLSSKVFDQMQGLYGAILPTGVHVNHVARQSHTSIGQDANGRWRTVQNFYCASHRPSAHRF